MSSLSPTQRKLLDRAYNDGLVFPRSHVAASIKGLERAGYLEHSPHGRGFHITPAGAQARARKEPRSDEQPRRKRA